MLFISLCGWGALDPIASTGEEKNTSWRRDVWCRRTRRNYPLTEGRPTCTARKQVFRLRATTAVDDHRNPYYIRRVESGLFRSRENAAIPFFFSLLGGRLFGRTP